MKTPLILDIRGNSLDDGPGIRTVIFFKGCPLSCVWCHNPESKKASAELSFDQSLCIGCDSCIRLCSQKALSRKHQGFVDRKKCTHCFSCTNVCPSGALSRVGKVLSVDEIMNIVMRDMPFYEHSGGGVTLSGGEPTLFMDFSSQLLQKCKEKRIHTIIETCGHFNWKEFESKILPWVDAIYYDIKLMDSSLHKKYCGVNNDTILNNFKKLVALFFQKKIDLLARTPLIPNITDTPENLAAIAQYLASLGIDRAILLPYNPLWHSKSKKLGVEETCEVLKKETWMDNNKIEKYKQIFSRMGLSV
ncbi:MAG: glycyl-radical enzyme activating protein [Spirochaetes bacterium]|nr:glycyl-radical enzyme activating protein [Spirochaetota bacterium]